MLHKNKKCTCKESPTFLITWKSELDGTGYDLEHELTLHKVPNDLIIEDDRFDERLFIEIIKTMKLTSIKRVTKEHTTIWKRL